MAVPAKNKRFEGFSQYKGRLRRTLMCLRMSFAGKILTVANSVFLEKLEEENPVGNFLLVSHKNICDDISELSQLSPHINLVFIFQVRDGELAPKISPPSLKASLSIWTDSTNSDASDVVYDVVAQLCKKPCLDLHSSKEWASFTSEFPPNGLPSTKAWFNDELAKLNCDLAQLTHVEGLTKAGLELISDKEPKISINANGKYLSICMSGTKVSKIDTSCEAIIKKFKDLHAQSITIGISENIQVEFRVNLINFKEPLKALIVCNQS